MKKLITAVATAVVATAVGLALLMPNAAAADEDKPPERLPIAGPSDFTVRQYIGAYADLYDTDRELMDCIARFESNYTPTAKNPASTASGVYQFLDKTFLWVTDEMGTDWTLDDRFDPHINIKAAMWLVNRDGPRHWEVYHPLHLCD